jgi:hypothetical protein
MSFRYLQRFHDFDSELASELEVIKQASPSPEPKKAPSLQDILEGADPLTRVKTIIQNKQQPQAAIIEHGVRKELKKTAAARRELVLDYMKEGE